MVISMVFIYLYSETHRGCLIVIWTNRFPKICVIIHTACQQKSTVSVFIDWFLNFVIKQLCLFFIFFVWIFNFGDIPPTATLYVDAFVVFIAAFLYILLLFIIKGYSYSFCASTFFIYPSITECIIFYIF